MAEGFVPEPSIPGDDTLLVNVFTPRPSAQSSPLPVLVWFHGGGYLGGSPSSPWYDGRAFNADGIVVVNVSYRLGFVGFGWVEGGDQNRGVLDWLAALEWVRDEIAAFGGDPSRVTIAGQSAGGGAVTTLLSMQAAQPLFAAAIAQSPAQGALSREKAVRTADRVADALNVSTDIDALTMIDESLILDAERDIARFGRSTPEESIADAFRSDDGELDVAFGPVLDGKILHNTGLMSGAEKPLLIGTTAHEFMMVAWPARRALEGVSPEELMSRHRVDATAASAYLRAGSINDSTSLVGQLVTDRTFRAPVDELSRRPRPAGCWLYDFRWTSPFLGVSLHCMELPFAWGLLDAEGVQRLLGPRPSPELGEQMHAAWCAFVVNGDPGWQRVDPAAPRGMVFDENTRLEDDPYAASRLVRSVDRRNGTLEAIAGAA